MLQYTILSQAKPKNLAPYAALCPAQARRVHNILQNPSLMRIILLNDGPRQEQYQSMLDLYHSILDASPRAKNGIQLNDIQGGHLRILRGNRGKFDQVRSQIGGGYDSCQVQCSEASVLDAEELTAVDDDDDDYGDGHDDEEEDDDDDDE